MIVLIAAAGENNELGKDDKLLWHLPDDFKRFKQLTTGHHIIMGRKTFESFPKPLPNRTHVVVSRNKEYKREGAITVGSIAEAIALVPEGQDGYVIGGGEIYTLAMPYADRLDITKVHASFDADAFFPEFDPKDWELVSSEPHPPDDRHAFGFTFTIYMRRTQKPIAN